MATSKKSAPAPKKAAPAKEAPAARRSLMIDQVDYDAKPTGDCTRLLRIVAGGWSKVKPAVRQALKVTVGTYTRRDKKLGRLVNAERKLRWNENGAAVVVDGSAVHAQVVALLIEHRIEYTENVLHGTWRVYGDRVLMSVPPGVASVEDVLRVGMPTLGRRGDRWRRWRGAPLLWMHARDLVQHLARCA